MFPSKIKVSKRLKCQQCIESFKFSHTSDEEIALLTTMKSHGRLIHPNSGIFKMLIIIEDSFQKYATCPDVIELVTTDICSNIQYKFPCTEHQEQMTSIIISYYLSTRIKPYTKMINLNTTKHNKTKKKMAKLTKT